MYLDALSFLEDEREAWRPFESLADLSDEELSRPVEGAHGWSGRDLMGHLLAWVDMSLAIAKELAVNEESPTMARVDAEYEAKGSDAMNADLLATWSQVPLPELRERFRATPGELRGYLTVVPETRWVKHPTHLRSFLDDTIEHYDEHVADLRAILAAAGR